jgi:RNA polymerase sigma-70 factor, ECF subfamily
VEIARLDELQLVQHCKEGSEAAFAELVRRHRPRLFTLAFRLTSDRDAAEDVVQETFVAAFRTLDRFEPRPSLAAWLNTIAVRNAGKAIARRTARPRASLDAMLEDDAAVRLIDATATDANDPHRAAEAAEVRREVAAAISALPFKYRAAVVTRFVLDLDYQEAAASLEMGLNTYKSHLLRGTRMLRDILAPITGRLRVEPEPEPIATPVLRAADAAMAAVASAASATTASRGGHGPSRAAAHAFAEPHRSHFEAVSSEKAVRG